MASNKQTPVVVPGAKDGLSEEEQLEEMLQHLNQVHVQLRQLRSALPRMLAPLMVKQPTPQAAFAAYMQSVDSTKKEVASFQEAFIGLYSDGVFAKASTSQKANPKGIKAWRASDDPDWTSSDRKRKRPPEGE